MWAKGSTTAARCTGSMLLIVIGSYLRRVRREPDHGIAEEGVPFREIAGVIGRRLNLAIVSKTAEEISEHFVWFAHFAAIENQASSQRTREQLGWQPKKPGLIPDIDLPSYFAASTVHA